MVTTQTTTLFIHHIFAGLCLSKLGSQVRNKYNCVQIKHFELTPHLRTSRAEPRRPHYQTWRGSCNMRQAHPGEAVDTVHLTSEVIEFLNYDIDKFRKVTLQLSFPV